MYMDGVVAYGLVIVALACVMLGYVGRFAYRHFKEDEAKAQQEK